MIGALRRRVSLARSEPVADGGGGFVDVWTLRGSVWAQEKPRGSREFGLDDATRRAGRVTLKVRAEVDVLPEDRATLDDRVYVVRDVRYADGARRHKLLDLEERGAP